MSPKFKGTVFGICAAVSYGMNPVFALPLYQHGMTPASVLFYRFSLSSFVLAVILFFRRENFFNISFCEFAELAGFGFLFALSSSSLYESFLYMSVGIACTILFTYPMIVAILAAVIFRERISFLIWFCIFLAFAGISLLYKGEDGAVLSTKGLLLVLFSSLMYALYLVLLRHCRAGKMKPGTMTYWILTTCAVFFIFRLKGLTELQAVPADFTAWSCVVSIVLIPTVVSIFCTNKAVQLIGSAPTAVLGALEPGTALAAGILLFHERLTVQNFCGFLMILAAVILLILEKKIYSFFTGKHSVSVESTSKEG